MSAGFVNKPPDSEVYTSNLHIHIHPVFLKCHIQQILSGAEEKDDLDANMITESLSVTACYRNYHGKINLSESQSILAMNGCVTICAHCRNERELL